MKKTLFIKNIKYLVTCDDNDTLMQNVGMLIENSQIKYIGSDTLQADRVIDAKNMIVYPGLINTHHHLYQTFSRNLAQVQNLELFDWLKTLYEIWKNLNSEIIYYSSLIGMAELLKTGCTTCLDHHYVFIKNASDDFLDMQFQAASDLNMRFFATRGSMDLSVKDGGLPPDSVVQSIDEILKSSEFLVKKYHDSSKFSMRQVALAPCSPFSVSKDLMKQTAQLARHLGVRLHTHLAETTDEERYTMQKYKLRPLDYLKTLDWVGSDVWYAHGIHFNDSELEFLAQTKTGVAHCPISNMKLSSGIAKIPKMLNLGVRVGLAVDGSASNDGSSMLEEIRVAYLLHRLNSSKYAPSGYDILKLATKGGAKILGRDDIGKLEVGMAGDFFMIDVNKVSLVGACFDPKSLLATVGYRQNVDYTIVNGEVVVENGKLVHMDEEKIIYNANKALVQYLKNN